jgi:hypothetical protein
MQCSPPCGPVIWHRRPATVVVVIHAIMHGDSCIGQSTLIPCISGAWTALTPLGESLAAPQIAQQLTTEQYLSLGHIVVRFTWLRSANAYRYGEHRTRPPRVGVIIPRSTSYPRELSRS